MAIPTTNSISESTARPSILGLGSRISTLEQEEEEVFEESDEEDAAFNSDHSNRDRPKAVQGTSY